MWERDNEVALFTVTPRVSGKLLVLGFFHGLGYRWSTELF